MHRVAALLLWSAQAELVVLSIAAATSATATVLRLQWAPATSETATPVLGASLELTRNVLSMSEPCNRLKTK
jgi:hypothetical protein